MTSELPLTNRFATTWVRGCPAVGGTGSKEAPGDVHRRRAKRRCRPFAPVGRLARWPVRPADVGRSSRDGRPASRRSSRDAHGPRTFDAGGRRFDHPRTQRADRDAVDDDTATPPGDGGDHADPDGSTDGDGDAVPGHEERPTVLVVDDDPALAGLLARWLGDDYDTRVVHDGEAALDAVDDGPVDLLLLDREMPILDGLETLERLRERGHDCPVAMVTGVPPDVDIADVPLDEYLTKPVTAEAIRATAERLLVHADAPASTREFHRLTRKRAVIEAAQPSSDLAESDAYARLEAALADAEDDAETNDGIDAAPERETG